MLMMMIILTVMVMIDMLAVFEVKAGLKITAGQWPDKMTVQNNL